MLAAFLITLLGILGIDAGIAGVLGVITHVKLGFLDWWLIVFLLNFFFAWLYRKN